HMPLLRNPDKSKLSKRKNPTSIHFYQRMGFMPEAVMNYLGRMGWSMPDEREKFTLDEMVAEFDIQRVSLGGPVFDVEKLRWLNGQWLRELSPEAFIQQYQAWGLSREFFEGVIKDIQSRSEVFSDVVNVAGFLLDGLPAIQPEQFDGLKLESDDLKAQLQRLVWRFETLSAWEKDEIFACCKQLSEELELKIRDFLAPVFIAISGKSASISVMDAMVILGSDMTRARLSHAIQVLGGISKKQMKKLEKLK
ncbi:MAG: glutamate--tRNA ligase family protein, partial [Pseudomonadota bacterium]|nr:glutamate--tRNA ligase family protein [Pseudomonadota bacterium]